MFFQTHIERNASIFQPTHPPIANKPPVSAQAGNWLIMEDLVQPFHQVCTLTGIGISSLVEQDPKQRHADFLMDHAQHQAIDMAAAKFLVCTVQGQMPRLARKYHDANNQPGETSFIKSNILEETLKATMDRQCLSSHINMSRKTSRLTVPV